MPHLQGDGPGAEQMKLPDNISRQTVYAIIDEWVIGERAERDREILLYLFIDGLTYEQIADRYQEHHPDCPVSIDTIKRIIKKRKHQIFKHFPG